MMEFQKMFAGSINLDEFDQIFVKIFEAEYTKEEKTQLEERGKKEKPQQRRQ